MWAEMGILKPRGGMGNAFVFREVFYEHIRFVGEEV